MKYLGACTFVALLLRDERTELFTETGFGSCMLDGAKKLLVAWEFGLRKKVTRVLCASGCG